MAASFALVHGTENLLVSQDMFHIASRRGERGIRQSSAEVQLC